MSIEHLDRLHEQLPELFEDRQLPVGWDDDVVLLPLDDSEGPPLPTAPQTDLPLSMGIASADAIEAVMMELVELGPTIVPIDLRWPEALLGAISGSHAGSPWNGGWGGTPPAEHLAFYLPFHYYHPHWWGIYLRPEGVIRVALDLRAFEPGLESAAAIGAAKAFLYHHEAFHHETECFATRLELSHRVPVFRVAFERLFQRVIGSDDCLEEGLANAYAIAAVLNSKRTPDRWKPELERALVEYVRGNPPGYRRGADFWKPAEHFRTTRCEFMEENQLEAFPGSGGLHPDVWRSFPHAFDGIANVRSRVNYYLPAYAPLLLRTRLRPLLPPRTVAHKLGLAFVRHGSRHDVYRAPNGRHIELPRHPRDLKPGLLRAILSAAGVEMGLSEFLRS